MNLYELFFLTGLFCLIISLSCFAVIRFKRSNWNLPFPSLSDSFSEGENRISKIGGVLVILSVALFIMGVLFFIFGHNN